MIEQESISSVREDITAHSQRMLALLQESLRCRSVSGSEALFVTMLADWARGHGFSVDQWVADEQELIRQFGPLPRHLPLANRPTLHIRLPGNPQKQSLLFNAHSDVVGVLDESQWRHDPWAGIIEAGRIYGRGACDVKGPIISALWAMLVLKQIPADQRGDVALELVPGEEDCVGLGTLSSIARGYTADAALVLEPTEGFPRCASRGGCRFEITAHGRAVHGTMKWKGVDSIAITQKILTALKNIEQRWNDRSADALFESYPIARPITVDRIEGGGWQGMICDRCVCAGYLELLPADDLSHAKEGLKAELHRALEMAGEDSGRMEIGFGEEYQGYTTAPDRLFCQMAEECVGQTWDGWRGFNSGCEAGVRANLLGTPTIVWGPGSLEQAHAVDEWISFRDIELAAEHFTQLVLSWVQRKKDA